MGVSLAEIAVGLLSTFHGSDREASLGLIAATDDKSVHGAEPSPNYLIAKLRCHLLVKRHVRNAFLRLLTLVHESYRDR
jgi:hypothetical protein